MKETEEGNPHPNQRVGVTLTGLKWGEIRTFPFVERQRKGCPRVEKGGGMTSPSWGVVQLWGEG